jgi:hypothetical protein
MVKYKTSSDMKDKIKEICNKLNREQISVQGATEQLFDLYNVVGQSEQLKAVEELVDFARDVTNVCDLDRLEEILDRL